MLVTKRIITNCPHQFVFIHGSGNGVRCALGNGDSILTTALSTNIATLIGDLAEYSSAREAISVTTNLFGTKFRPDVLQLQWAMLRDYPQSGFTNAESFRAWWSDRKIDVAETKTSLTEQMTDFK